MINTRVMPDYIRDPQASHRLARMIETYYHRRGHKEVKAWVESEINSLGAKTYSVRSNLKFSF